MTVFSHFYSEPCYVFKIDRSCFYPVPNVHGALAIFKLRPVIEWPEVRDDREFCVFVRQAFLSKRKMLTNSLQPMWSRETVLIALEKLGLSDQVSCFDLCQVNGPNRLACVAPASNKLFGLNECVNTIWRAMASDETTLF